MVRPALAPALALASLPVIMPAIPTCPASHAHASAQLRLQFSLASTQPRSSFSSSTAAGAGADAGTGSGSTTESSSSASASPAFNGASSFTVSSVLSVLGAISAVALFL